MGMFALCSNREPRRNVTGERFGWQRQLPSSMQTWMPFMPRSSSCSTLRYAANPSLLVVGWCLPLPTKRRPSGSAAACRDGRRASSVHTHFCQRPFQRLSTVRRRRHQGDRRFHTPRRADFHRRGLCRRCGLHPSLRSACRNCEGNPPTRAGGAGPSDLSRCSAHQASGKNCLASGQARRTGGCRSRHRAAIPSPPAGRTDVGSGAGHEGAAGRDRRANDRAAGKDTGMVARTVARSRGMGETPGAGVESRPREIKGKRRARSAGAQSAIGRKPAEERVFRPTLLHLADRIGTRLRAKSRPGRTVTIRVRFANLNSATRSVTLDAPISATVILAKLAKELVRAVLADHPDEKTISLLAISVSHLEEHWDLELELPLGLENEARRPGTKIGMARWAADCAVDKIRDRFGWDAIGYGSVALGMSHSVPDEFRKLAEKDLLPSPAHLIFSGTSAQLQLAAG